MNFPFKILSYGLSDPGLVRSNNEDIFAALPERSFFVLADGMGGHRAGEVAAQEAISHLCQSVEEIYLASYHTLSIQELSQHLESCIEKSNNWVHYLSKRHEHLHGMGTTLCAALFHDHSMIYAHVGDSRIYRKRAAELLQVTNDHSLRNKEPHRNKSPSSNIYIRHIVTQAIGINICVQPEVGIIDVNPKDLYLLCSDGLSDYVSHENILDILSRNASIETMTQDLIEAAKSKGGGDNITALLVYIDEIHE